MSTELLGDELKAWRKQMRERLIAARLALDAAQLEAHRSAVDGFLERLLDALGIREGSTIAFCWPFRNEYDARHLAHRLRDRGVHSALPVVVAPRTPLIFRCWKPGDPLARGVYDIPYPSTGEAVVPHVALVPMNGFDERGYRLGYGGGFFDRTLANLRAGGADRENRPAAIGIAFELARLPSIHPQLHDIPMDWVVTERAVHRRADDKLVPEVV